MMKTACFFAHILFLLLPLCSTAQGKINLDSLDRACQAYQETDTIKIKMLLRLSQELSRSNPTKGASVAAEAVSLAEQLHQPLLQSYALNNQGINNKVAGKYTDAVVLHERALLIADSLGGKRGIAVCLNNIGTAYNFQLEYKKAIGYYERALALFVEAGDRASEGACLRSLGAAYSNISEKEKAQYYETKAEKLLESLGNLDELVVIYINRSIDYTQTADYPKALEHLQKAMHLNEKLKNKTNTYAINNSLGVIYGRLNDTEQALLYHFKALDVQKEIGNELYIARTYINIGSQYYNSKKFTKALEYQQLALEIVTKLKNKSTTATCQTNMATTYMALSDYSSALSYFEKAMPVFKELGREREYSRSLTNVSEIYLKAPDSVLLKASIDPMKRFSLSEEKCLESLKIATPLEALDIVQSAWVSLSEIYEKKGDYISAYDAYKKHILYRDSISGDDIKNQITRKEIQYEYDKKETVLKYEQQLTVEQLAQQKLLSIQQEQALNIKQQALTISNKEKDLQRLAYLKEKAEKQEKEQQLSLAEKDKQIQEVQLGALLQDKALQLQTLAKQNALIGFLLAGLAAILLGFAAFSFWQRQKRAKKEAAVQVQYTQQLLENTEEERGRIARDLHDGVSHELLTLKKTLQNTEAGQKIDGIINDIRQISRNLHPVMLESIGLKLSLETLCDQYMEQDELFISHDINYNKRLPGTVELQLFRIVQEAITNTIKYAGADACQVVLHEQNNTLQLVVRDNGRGFNVDEALDSGKAFGLRSILQRSRAIGGQSDIRSSAQGTVIAVTVGA